MSESKNIQKQVQPHAQLNLKSIQHQDQLKAKVRPRVTTQLSQKDKVKYIKKTKLLSFQQQLEEASPKKQDKFKRVDITQKDLKRLQLSKLNGKGNIQQNLKAQFQSKIQKLKDQMFEFDYSYWDGPLVVKKLKRKKKQTVGSLIQICRLQLIATCPVEDLLLVIKDFIVPHKMTIADIQALELKTTKGDCLLNFKNVKIKDVTLSVNVQGPIRIIEKVKYEKNIANYPFNTWQKMNID